MLSVSILCSVSVLGGFRYMICFLHPYLPSGWCESPCVRPRLPLAGALRTALVFGSEGSNHMIGAKRARLEMDAFVPLKFHVF